MRFILPNLIKQTNKCLIEKEKSRKKCLCSSDNAWYIFATHTDIYKNMAQMRGKRAPETRVNMSLWTFELTKLRNNLKIIFRPSTIYPRHSTSYPRPSTKRQTPLALLMVLGPHKDRRNLWPGWELNQRPSGLITAAPWPPTELEWEQVVGKEDVNCTAMNRICSSKGRITLLQTLAV